MTRHSGLVVGVCWIGGCDSNTSGRHGTVIADTTAEGVEEEAEEEEKGVGEEVMRG